MGLSCVTCGGWLLPPQECADYAVCSVSPTPKPQGHLRRRTEDFRPTDDSYLDFCNCVRGGQILLLITAHAEMGEVVSSWASASLGLSSEGTEVVGLQRSVRVRERAFSVYVSVCIGGVGATAAGSCLAVEEMGAERWLIVGHWVVVMPQPN